MRHLVFALILAFAVGMGAYAVTLNMSRTTEAVAAIEQPAPPFKLEQITANIGGGNTRHWVTMRIAVVFGNMTEYEAAMQDPGYVEMILRDVTIRSLFEASIEQINDWPAFERHLIQEMNDTLEGITVEQIILLERIIS